MNGILVQRKTGYHGEFKYHDEKMSSLIIVQEMGYSLQRSIGKGSPRDTPNYFVQHFDRKSYPFHILSFSYAVHMNKSPKKVFLSFSISAYY